MEISQSSPHKPHNKKAGRQTGRQAGKQANKPHYWTTRLWLELRTSTTRSELWSSWQNGLLRSSGRGVAQSKVPNHQVVGFDRLSGERFVGSQKPGFVAAPCRAAPTNPKQEKIVSTLGSKEMGWWTWKSVDQSNTAVAQKHLNWHLGKWNQRLKPAKP